MRQHVGFLVLSWALIGACSACSAPAADAAFLEWSMQNGRVGREPVREIHLSADEDRPELSGVTLRLWLLRQSDGAHLFQVRIDGTGGLCGFVEGLLEIDGNTGRFINDPDEISASRPHYPHVCEPDPQPGTIDAVLVAPFGLVLEPGGLAMSNSAGEVRFVVRND